ncbi:hypothetical protein D3C85_1685660 [compost metagenome]
MQFVQLSAKINVVIYTMVSELLNYMFVEVNTCNPTIFHVLKPLLVIAIIRSMKIEYVFSNEDEFIDSLVNHQLQDFPF